MMPRDLPRGAAKQNICLIYDFEGAMSVDFQGIY